MMYKINNLRLRQRLLKIELKNAKRRILVPDDRWNFDLHVEDSMDWKNPSFLEALESETFILKKRVDACKSHVLLVTCFDSFPINQTRNNINDVSLPKFKIS